MIPRGFQAKLLYLMVAVLVLLQTVTLVAVHVAGERTLRRSLDEELRVGSRVLVRVISNRGLQLSHAVRLLTADFAFREAIASGDAPTIASVLSNHGARVEADVAFLISLEGVVEADADGNRFAGRPFTTPALLKTAEEEGEARAIVSFEQKPYQFVVVPVLAPRPIAWVCMGFAIEQDVLQDVHRLTSLDVSLWSNGATGDSSLISTLSPVEQTELVTAMRAETLSPAGDATRTLELRSEDYESLLESLPTADGSEIYTLLQRSIDEAREPYTQLEFQIFLLSMLALLAAVLAAIFFARGVSEPLQRLSQEAARIERGDYSTSIELPGRDELGRLARAFNSMRDGIAEREERIRFQATHDSLTGLPNRTLFLDRLAQAIASSRRSGEIVGMLMMDVDRFKEINDTLGHPFGDDLLNEIGRRLSQTLRESDTVARLGGDEFAVMFRTDDAAKANDVARRIGGAFSTPFALAGITIDVHASMGIALYPQHAEDADTLMKRADIAMYHAKRNHTAFEMYEPGRDEHSLRRLAILSELRRAVENDELQLHYQPKIDVSSERAVHAEALVRWKHPLHGMMPPDEFIGLAEQSGLISVITRWVLRRAIGDCGAWNRDGIDLTIAVNLSALDLYDQELPTFISGLLSEAGLPASKLVLEITESGVMRDPVYAGKILSALKQRGIALAIDDFGTGYSSLAHLKRLPVDELKIDKSFVLQLDAPADDDLVIVRSTIELGHQMGLKVIAEGVESLASWTILKGLGCDMAQGYYISRPLPADEFQRWMRESDWADGRRSDASRGAGGAR